MFLCSAQLVYHFNDTLKLSPCCWNTNISYNYLLFNSKLVKTIDIFLIKLYTIILGENNLEEGDPRKDVGKQFIQPQQSYPDMSRWLLVTLMFGSLGCGVVIGFMVINVIVIKLVEKVNTVGRNEEELVPYSPDTPL